MNHDSGKFFSNFKELKSNAKSKNKIRKNIFCLFISGSPSCLDLANKVFLICFSWWAVWPFWEVKIGYAEKLCLEQIKTFRVNEIKCHELKSGVDNKVGL